MNITHHISLAPFTTFEIGGKADEFIEVSDTRALIDALQFCREVKKPFVILAGGSNMLFADEGFRGVVIRIATNNFSLEGEVLKADAGCNLLELIRFAAEKGYGGWSSIAGIPGTIGGAVRGNAGAFGTEIKDVLMSAKAIHSESFEQKEFSNAECEFAYRNSFFKQNPKWIIVSADVKLAPVESSVIASEIENTIRERERRHLQNVRAAGSFFMNPVAPRAVQEQFETEKHTQSREGRVPAGWLIEKVGLKGARVGGAIASLQHPNYLVNERNASANDVLELAAKIKDAVEKEFAIELREEAAIVV